jgi:hypothetical protein
MYSMDVLRDVTKDIALGELKRGIDPAGADEHLEDGKGRSRSNRRGILETEAEAISVLCRGRD